MVYFIHCEDLKTVKIGYSAEPEKRLKQLQTANPYPLKLLGSIDGGFEKEAELHAKFSPNSLGGEWFRCDDGMLKAIAQITFSPMKLWGQEITDVYLAGKITGDRWREGILGHPYGFVVPDVESEWLAKGSVSIPDDTRRLNYRGPFWLDPTGHSLDNPGAHAFGDRDVSDHCDGYTTPSLYIRKRCFDGINKSQLLFAWVTSRDCFGTIAEIAYARGLRGERRSYVPLVIIASRSDRLIGDMWFVYAMADHFVCADTPDEAWRSIWKARHANPWFHSGNLSVIRSGYESALFDYAAEEQHAGFEDYPEF